MYFYLIIIVLLLLILYYHEKKTITSVVVSPPVPVPPSTTVPVENFDVDWNVVSQDISLDPGIIKSQRKYVANVREFGTGANFTDVADDNNSDIFTNFLGFSRPRYVKILPGARQIPDVDTSVLKRNKRLAFISDYDL